MAKRFVGSSCAAAVFAMAAIAAGQSTTPSPTQAPAQGGNPSPADAQSTRAQNDQVTLVGCVARVD